MAIYQYRYDYNYAQLIWGVAIEQTVIYVNMCANVDSLLTHTMETARAY